MHENTQSNVRAFRNEHEAILAVIAELRVTVSHKDQVIEHLSDANRTLSEELMKTKDELRVTTEAFTLLRNRIHEAAQLNKVS